MSSLQQADLQAVLEDRYTLEREVGEGGMATVFLAHDRKHDRSVALKVLKRELGAVLGAERFLAEIRVMANLHHPHLLPLFDSGEAAGLLYYVMPYVDGESLRARLARERQLPIGEAVNIAVAVAGALDYAHRHGVVHRDLKPENILLQEGLPLVADFGVALAVSRAGGARVTQSGLAVGTPQYMSPEQAAGERQLDARSDVYALGAVLYEMLTGEPPHVGASTQVVVARVINEPPRPVRATRPTIPEHVELAVLRALEKVPADRFASAREFALALSPASSGTLTARTPGARPMATRASRPTVSVLAMAGGMLLLAGATGWWWGAHDRPVMKTTRFVVSALPNEAGPPVVTPDGNSLVYVGTVKGRRALLVRHLDSLAARELPGTEGALGLFFSPDGRSVGFFTTSDALRKVPIEGGVSTPLAKSLRFGIGSWSDEGVIVTDAASTLGLAWVAALGGTVHQLTRIDTTRKENRHFAPFVLPGGRGVIFRATGGFRAGSAQDAGDLAFVRLDQSRASPAIHTPVGVRGRYAIALLDGWLLYAGDDYRSILAVRFDAESGRASGDPVTVVQEEDALIGQVSLSRDGTLVYSRPPSITNEAKLVDAAGAARPLLMPWVSGSYMNPRLSPDGGRLAVQGTSPEGTDVWVYDIATQANSRLTTDGSVLNPAWTPDGQHVVYVKVQGGSELWRVAVNGSTPPERIFTAAGIALSMSVQPDGRGVVFQRRFGEHWSLWSASLSPGASPRALLQEPFDDYMPTLSSDGHWLAYVSNSTGKDEIYVRPYPSIGTATQISDDGGTEPRWSHDGHRIFYRNATGLHAATLATGSEMSVTNRATLFSDGFEGGMPHANYDVGRGDTSFVMLAPVTKGEAQTVVVVNWLRELEARLASAR